jgi:hypothetical protein
MRAYAHLVLPKRPPYWGSALQVSRREVPEVICPFYLWEEHSRSKGSLFMPKRKTPLKTGKTNGNVAEFLEKIADGMRQAQAKELMRLIKSETKESPKMWGTSIVGFGRRTLKYSSGREIEWMKIGFSPRKAANVLYLSEGFEKSADLLGALGKHKKGKGCLYLPDLREVDLAVLKKLIRSSLKRSTS